MKVVSIEEGRMLRLFSSHESSTCGGRKNANTLVTLTWLRTTATVCVDIGTSLQDDLIWCSASRTLPTKRGRGRPLLQLSTLSTVGNLRDRVARSRRGEKKKVKKRKKKYYERFIVFIYHNKFLYQIVSLEELSEFKESCSV